MARLLTSRCGVRSLTYNVHCVSCGRHRTEHPWYRQMYRHHGYRGVFSTLQIRPRKPL